MHYAAATAYAKTARATQSPRELEASLLIKAAQRLQAAGDNWQGEGEGEGKAGGRGPGPELGDALTFNRRLWTVLATSATDPANPLPAPIKANVAQLATIIFERTVSILVDPRPERLALLVRINRDIASGLRSAPGAP